MESNTTTKGTVLSAHKLFSFFRIMKKHRKPISTWENTVARKCAVIALVAISPIWIILQIVWCIITHGVPEAWDNTLELFRADTIDSIKEAWIGRKQYRQNAIGHTPGATEKP